MVAGALPVCPQAHETKNPVVTKAREHPAAGEALLGIAELLPEVRANASGESRKQEGRGHHRAPLPRQGVYMIMMFPIVIAVTLLLALGEVATGEARRNRFAAQ